MWPGNEPRSVCYMFSNIYFPNFCMLRLQGSSFNDGLWTTYWTFRGYLLVRYNFVSLWVSEMSFCVTLFYRIKSKNQYDTMPRGMTHRPVNWVNAQRDSVTRSFASGFSWISFPPAPEYPIRTVSIFFENSPRYSQVSMTLVANCHRDHYQQYRWQILPQVLLVLSILVANFPPVSNTQAANFATSFTSVVAANSPPVSMTPVEIMGTISGCRHLKENLKAKCICKLTLLLKGVQTK